MRNPPPSSMMATVCPEPSRGLPWNLSGEVVAFREFRGGDAVLAPRPRRCRSHKFAPVWRLVLGAGVEAEHSGHDPQQLLGKMNFALAAAIGSGGVMKHAEVGGESVQQVA